MVGKLVKHDFLESRRKFVPVVGSIVALTLIILMLTRSEFSGGGASFIMSVSILLMFGLSIAAVVLSFMAYIDLLYTSMYNKNGYKLFTLPVKSWEIVASKIIVSFIWTIIISAVTIVSAYLFLLITMSGFEGWEYITSFFKYLTAQVDIRVFAVWTLNVIASTIFSISLFLFVGSIVGSSYVQNKRNFKMFVFYLITAIVVGNVIGLLNLNASIFEVSFSPELLESAIMSGFDPLVDGWETIMQFYVNVEGIQHMVYLALIRLCIGSLFIYGTIWFWNNKLEIID